MKNDFIFITDKAWFESTTLRNPVASLDHRLEAHFPEFYSVYYDIKLLATKPLTKKEEQFIFHNDFRNEFGTKDHHALDAAIIDADAKNVFLNGFNQKHFLHIAPGLKDTAEVIYFFKCPQIHDLSVLSQFTRLKCVHIYWNNALESLWDMRNNKQLKVISCTTISKLRKIEMLKNSSVEYVCLDSSDNYGHKKNALFDITVFDQMPHLKHLSLIYADYEINY